MEAVDRAKLPMKNYETLKGLSTPELAKLICYLCHDCENCPINEHKTWSMKACRDILEAWLKKSKDEDFWAYLLEREE